MVTTWSLPYCPILCLAFLQNIQKMKMTMKLCPRPLQVAGVFSLLFSFLSQDIASSHTQHEMQALHSGHWPSHNPLLGLFLHCAFISRASPTDFFFFAPNCTSMYKFATIVIAVKWCKISCWCKINCDLFHPVWLKHKNTSSYMCVYMHMYIHVWRCVYA